MKLRLTAFICLILVLSLGCRRFGKRVTGNGNVAVENRNVHEASKIKVAGGMDVVIDSGATNVRVEADENIIPYVETKEVNGALQIHLKKNINVITKNDITVYVTTPYLTNVDLAGGGSVTSKNKFWSKERMVFDIGGSGNITMEVNAPQITGNIGGSGNLSLSGETRNVNVHIGGSGNYRGLDLKAENAEVSIGGSGNASVFADVDLKVSVAGSGDIKYKGNASVHKSIVGSGSVTKVE